MTEAILIQPITATYNMPAKTTQVLAGSEPGQKRIVETFFNVTIYDRGGKLQQITNSHQVNYMI